MSTPRTAGTPPLRHSLRTVTCEPKLGDCDPISAGVGGRLLTESRLLLGTPVCHAYARGIVGATVSAAQVLQYSASAVAWPVMLIGLTDLIDKPWTIACER